MIENLTSQFSNSSLHLIRLSTGTLSAMANTDLPAVQHTSHQEGPLYEWTTQQVTVVSGGRGFWGPEEVHDKRVSRGRPGKQVADVAGRETKEKNSIIRYEPTEGAAARTAANSEGGREQMLHVGGGRWRGRRSSPSVLLPVTYLFCLLLEMPHIHNTEQLLQIFTL